MNSFARKAAWLSSKHIPFKTCRVVAGRRFPHNTRTFRCPSHLRLPQDDAVDTTTSGWNHVLDQGATPLPEDVSNSRTEEVTEDADTTVEELQEPGEVSDSAEAALEKPIRPKDRGTYGSAVRRAGRNVRRAKDPPAVTVPTWFLERNVRLHEDANEDEEPRLFTQNFSSSSRVTPQQDVKNERMAQSIESVAPSSPSQANNHTATTQTSSSNVPNPLGATSDINYEIDSRILTEISAMVSAGLRPASLGYADTYPASKPHILLQCPKDGGILFLDTVVTKIASEEGADLIKIDAQDIAEVAGEHGGDLAEFPSNSVRSLGYDTHLMMARQDKQGADESTEEQEDYYEGEDAMDQPSRNKQSQNISHTKMTVTPVMTFLGSIKLSDFLGRPRGATTNSSTSAEPSRSLDPFGQNPPLMATNPAQAESSKTFQILEAFIDAARLKRKIHLRSAAHGIEAVQTESPPSPADSIASHDAKDSSSNGKPLLKKLIILIRDYAEMNSTQSGGAVLSRLHEVVRQRRKEGQSILIIGTSSSEDLIPSISKSGFTELQTEPGQGPYRTIITPCCNPSADTIFALDEKLRIQSINARHLQDMLRKLAANPKNVNNIVSQSALELEIDSATMFSSGFDESIWSFDRVHRTALVILGLLGKEEELASAHIVRALNILQSSDDAKFDWIAQEKERQRLLEIPSPGTASSLELKKKESADRLTKLRKTCNSYEKKLLSGVVDASSITTTFADIRAPPATIDALQTLISLSLIRPEAFTYGVLATDKIPGLLLYGPSGTGKTLLARAVAKESGATVLSVSGSDVYDMYVGEGEKNVRAIFSLAQKLSPCVVFIDEADALFASRGTAAARTSHRDLINQFLREWDGMQHCDAFIMVATNRPYDLDDAVLRRLPRRLLVDLPTQADREAILRIHLQHEQLAPSISLAALAAQTPFYSGSDLKNVCVAAALAAVRAELDGAKRHAAGEAEGPYKYPSQRTLSAEHFAQALDEISASVSEDMSSLGAIRKFDEKYGERRGRRTSAGYGFGKKERRGGEVVRVRS